MNPIFILPGLVIAAIGFVLLSGLLASAGALAKSKQFAAFGDLSSGRLGPGKRRLFRIAIAALALGSCGVFAGVARSDQARARACSDSCRADGFTSGKIGGSTERRPQNPNVHLFVACICTGPSGTRETPADTLSF
jgi:hypothetical protein